MSDLNEKTAVDTGEHEMEVSTVRLLVAHGPGLNFQYETCVFHEHGSNIIDRYENKEEAKAAHERIVAALEAGEYSFETPTTVKRLSVNT